LKRKNKKRQDFSRIAVLVAVVFLLLWWLGGGRDQLVRAGPEVGHQPEPPKGAYKQFDDELTKLLNYELALNSQVTLIDRVKILVDLGLLDEQVLTDLEKGKLSEKNLDLIEEKIKPGEVKLEQRINELKLDLKEKLPKFSDKDLLEAQKYLREELKAFNDFVEKYGGQGVDLSVRGFLRDHELMISNEVADRIIERGGSDLERERLSSLKNIEQELKDLKTLEERFEIEIESHSEGERILDKPELDDSERQKVKNKLAAAKGRIDGLEKEIKDKLEGLRERNKQLLTELEQLAPLNKLIEDLEKGKPIGNSLSDVTARVERELTDIRAGAFGRDLPPPRLTPTRAGLEEELAKIQMQIKAAQRLAEELEFGRLKNQLLEAGVPRALIGDLEVKQAMEDFNEAKKNLADNPNNTNARQALEKATNELESAINKTGVKFKLKPPRRIGNLLRGFWRGFRGTLPGIFGGIGAGVLLGPSPVEEYEQGPPGNTTR